MGGAPAGGAQADADAAGAVPWFGMSERQHSFLRHAVTEIHGRYFVEPSRSGSNARWLVGYHGQAQTAEAFLEDLARVARGANWLRVSIQGLNRHYAGRAQAIVASWMTSQDRELAIADNVRWVDAVLDQVEREFGAPRAIVHAGFSQGVAMAYRAGLLGRRPAAGIVAACGDVPPELLSDRARVWPYAPGPLQQGDLSDLRLRRGARRPVRQLWQPARPDRPHRPAFGGGRLDA